MSAPSLPAQQHNARGAALLAAGRAAEAVEAFRAALASHRAYPEACFNLANAYATLGRWDDAATAYRQTVALLPGLAQAHNNLGIALSALGRVEDAVKSFRAAIAARNAYPEAYYNLGSELAKLQRWDEAIASYRKALALKPQFPAVQNNLGIGLSALGHTAEAADAFRAAITQQPAYAEAHYNLASELAKLGQAEDALAGYAKAIALKPDFAIAHNNLGNMLLGLGRLEEAAQSLSRAADLGNATACYNLADALAQMSRGDEAVAAYRRALSMRPDFPEAYNNLGRLLFSRGRLDEAHETLRKAIALRPIYPEASCNLGNVLADLGKIEDAVAAYQRALSAKPDFAEAYNNLSIILAAAERPAEAAAAAEKAVALAPAVPEHHVNLGNALSACERKDDAIAAFRNALSRDPNHAEALTSLGNVLLQARGRFDEEGHRLLRQAYGLRPVSKRPAKITTPRFSVLLINAPGLDNTPIDYLVSRAPFDCNFIPWLPGVDYDFDLLRASGDVVVNLVSDADWSRDATPELAAFADRIGRPVLNHPRGIPATAREKIVERLAGMANCRLPKVLKAPGSALLGAAAAKTLEGFSYPLLLRITGTHGGADFEKIEGPEGVALMVERNPNAEYYAIEYVPYESKDGRFRKYRFIFTDGQIFPYHLAIGDHWKVHHFRTAMADIEWMRREEEAFVARPEAVFAPEHWEILRRIQAEIGLDYFGIDCGIDQAGALLVFEVNATMLVHGEMGLFAYKQPYITRIKEAFGAMLAKAAGRA